MPQLTDQDDIIAQNEQLTERLAVARSTIANLETNLKNVRAESETLKNQLEESRKEASTSKTLLETLRADDAAQKALLEEARKNNSAFQDNLTVRAKERDDLKAENEILKLKLADFDKAVAAKVAQLGFSQKAISQPTPTKTEGSVNYTELCRAAKGC